MKLQTKLLILVIPLIVLPLIILGLLGYARLQEMSGELILREADILVEELSESVELLLNTAQANLELFAGSALLQKYLLTADEAQRYTLLQPSLMRLLSSYQAAYPEYYEIRIILPDGYEDTRLTRERIPNLTEQEQDSAEFQQLQQSGADGILTFLHNPDVQRSALYVGKPLRLRDPSVDPLVAEPILRGYLVVTIDPAFIVQEVAEHTAGLSGFLFFTDANGNILFHRDTAYVDEQMPPELFVNLRNAFNRKAVLQAELDGEPVLLVGRRIEEKFFLVAVVPQRDFSAASRAMSRLVGYVTVVAILVTLTLVILLLKRLLISRISKLAQAAKEIGHGNLTVSVDTNWQDEIGDLARSFKEMADNLQNSQQHIERLAFYDSLTGLPNRLLFNQQLDYAIAHARRYNKPLALLFLDFDNFKWINDTLSHKVGDTFLREMADRIASALRKEDMVVRGSHSEDSIVARLGGDEFLVLVRELNSAHDAGVVARRILGALTKPLSLAGYDINVSASIGITLWPDDGDQADELIKTADIAMYEAKRRGKGRYQYYSSTMEDVAARRLTLETRLRHALNTGQLLLYYQPQVDVANHQVVGFEALLRWQHPEFGMITPDVFIPLAEETGLIIPVTAWVLDEACRQTKQWQKDGLGDLSVSINISGIDVERTNLSEIVANTLTVNQFSAQSLVLELTETSVMAAQDKVVPTLAELKEQGVKIALDDFGTGYSSLNHLKQLPIDELKIDRSFLANLPLSKDDAAIVSMIMVIAQTLRLKVTAEGVETQEMFEFVKEAKCDYAQGFLFSSPVPAGSIPQFMKRFSSSAESPNSIISG